MKLSFFQKIEELDGIKIELSCFQLYIHRYQFEGVEDRDDSNWLYVTAISDTEDTMVFTQGSILQTFDLKRFLDQVVQIFEKLNGIAELAPLEPNFSLKLQALKYGHISMNLYITPDHLNQKHEYNFQIDQSYLPKLICELEKALNHFPIR